MVGSLVISLLLTVVLETILALLINVRDKEDLSEIFWINCFTNPIIVYFTNITLLYTNDLISHCILVILEIINVFVEGYLLKNHLKKTKINPYIFSLYLNGFSFVIGIILGYILEF